MSIEASEVGLNFGRTAILSGVTLRLNPGELLAVIGPNGAGKSTLLKAMAGDPLPFAGSVTVNRKPIRSWRPVELARLRAVLPQETTMAFPVSALEVVLTGRHPHSRRSETDHDLAIARAALRRTGMCHLAERDYRTLSGGERQRVQMARVLAQIWKPVPEGHRFLFLDEHTASLDPRFQHAMFRLAREVAQRAVGVFAVVHDLNLAATYADRIAVLHGGRLAAIGTPSAVLTESLLGEVFGIRAVVTAHPLTGGPLVVTGEPGCAPVPLALGAGGAA